MENAEENAKQIAKSERAYREAVSFIEALSNSSDVHYISFYDEGSGRFADLETIPEKIKYLESLNKVDLRGTKIVDLSPLKNINSLQHLNIEQTEIVDLRSLLEFSSVSRHSSSFRIDFYGCKATEHDRNLKEISSETDTRQRTVRLLNHLRTLPPFPTYLQHERDKWEEWQNVQARNIQYIQNSLPKITENYHKLQMQDAEAQAKTKSELNKLTNACETEVKATKELTENARNEIQAIQDETRLRIESFEKSFKENVTIKAPIELWKDKQQEHRKNQNLAFGLFFVGMIFTAGIGVAILIQIYRNPVLVDSMLASSFNCSDAGCSGVGIKTGLIVLSLITLITMLLWFTRLQMKLYLAERHMRQDARERQAFAESYVGLIAEGDTSEEAVQQRALVYSALFRPSSDGTVKDDGGLDPSIAAGLSKFLSSSK